MANMMQMMAKAQKFKSKMEELQGRVRAEIVDGSVQNGLITCKMTGNFALKEIKIGDSLVKVEDKDMLEDLIVAAVNNARENAEQLMQSETQKLMAEMGLPAEMAGLL
ncbi:MAG: YbaB/EbfC family nucleoid-associated protein [Alphaproteobacteria bacterium]|nr:YbaB/EbfC family nucleoid-associated protein [Alphaproteobacteria bacterium]